MIKKKCEEQSMKAKIRKGGVCLLVAFGVMLSGISGFAAYRASAETVPNKSDSIPVDEADELFPTETIPEEYETDNFYVQMNNELLNAIYDYEDGKITEEEYFAICKEIDEAVNSEEGLEKLQEDEEKFKELTGGDTNEQ